MKKSVRNDPVHNGKHLNPEDLNKIIPEVKKVINSYVSRDAKLLDFDSNKKNIGDSKWDELFLTCSYFDSKKSNYVLIIGKTNDIEIEDLSYVCSIPWTMVIDFDPESKISGLYNAYYSKKGLTPHYISKKQFENVSFSANTKVPYWLFALGDIDVKETLVKETKEWQRTYYPKLRNLIQDFAGAFPKNTKVVIMHDAASIIVPICIEFDLSYEDRVSFIIATNSKPFSGLMDSLNPVMIEMDLPSFVKGIQRYEAYFAPRLSSSNNILLPAKGGDKVLDKDEYAAMQEDLDIIYKGIEYDNPDEEKNEIYFYRGSKVSWFGLDKHFDVDRKITKDILESIRQALYKGDGGVIEIPHEPGVGGSTVARRIAWEMHDDYPTMFVRNYRPSTAQNIVRLFRKTTKTILVFIEISEIGLDNAKRLYGSVKAETVPVLFILIKRRGFDYNEQKSYSKLVSYLNDKECKKIIDKLTPYIKELYLDTKLIRIKEEELLDVYSKSGDIARRTPFYLGLVAFEEKFLGIPNYIKQFLDRLTEVQKQILASISLVYYYTGQTTPSKLFASMLNLTQNSDEIFDAIELEEVFPLDFRLDSILIWEIRNNELYYRPRHLLFAKEIMIQVMGGINSGELWKQNITEYAIPIIEMSQIKGGTQSQEIIQLLRDLFISRGSEEIAIERFSKLIMDLIDAAAIDSVGHIFKKLVEVYPEESHFWGHLARYYSFVGDVSKAIESANNAIKFVPNDPILHHIKGMCLKEEARRLGKQLIDSQPLSSADEFNKMKAKWYEKIAEAAFEFSGRRESTSDLPGYISHIQMLVETIDTGRRLSGCATQEEFFEENKEPLYVQCVDQAFTLLEEAKSLDPEGEDFFLAKAEEQVLKLFRNYKKIIQTWSAMLKYGSNKPAIRRQIIRAHQYAASGFEHYSEDKLHELLTLLELNILEDNRNGANINLWFKVARCSKGVSIDNALGKLLKWKTNTELIIADYYFYVLKSIKGINGNSLAVEESLALLASLKQKARTLPNQIKIFEWLGNIKGGELSQLVENKRIEERGENGVNDLLKIVEGTISNWKHPGYGTIDVQGIEVFFRPGQGNDKSGIYETDQGKRVKFYLGFSFDGPRAFDNSVKTIDYLKMTEATDTAATATVSRKLNIDDIVDCKVVGNGPYHVFTSIEGVSEKCSIYYKDIGDSYNKITRPNIGQVMKAAVVNYTSQHGYSLSIKALLTPRDSSLLENESPLAMEIKKWMKNREK